MQPLTQFQDQSLDVAYFLLNIYKPTLRSSSLFDSGPLRVDPPTLDKVIPVEIQYFTFRIVILQGNTSIFLVG